MEMEKFDLYPIRINGINVSSEVELLQRSSVSMNDIHTTLSAELEEKIKKNFNLKKNIDSMPPISSFPGLKKYQEKFENYSKCQHTLNLGNDFTKINSTLPIGQKLIHCGDLFKGKSEIMTKRYLSTTYSLAEAMSGSSDSPNPRMHVLTIKTPGIKAYFYNGYEYECEVLLQKGIRLIKKNTVTIQKTGPYQIYDTIIEVDVFL